MFETYGVVDSRWLTPSCVVEVQLLTGSGTKSCWSEYEFQRLQGMFTTQRTCFDCISPSFAYTVAAGRNVVCRRQLKLSSQITCFIFSIYVAKHIYTGALAVYSYCARVNATYFSPLVFDCSVVHRSLIPRFCKCKWCLYGCRCVEISIVFLLYIYFIISMWWINAIYIWLMWVYCHAGLWKLKHIWKIPYVLHQTQTLSRFFSGHRLAEAIFRRLSGIFFFSGDGG